MLNSKLTAMEVSEIKRRFKLGETRTALAECFGVSRHTIYHHCKRVDLPKRGNFAEMHGEAVRQAWLMGVEAWDLAEQYSVSETTIRKVTKGLPSGRKRGRVRSFDYSKVVSLKQQGLPNRVIAARFGIDRSTVSHVLRREASE